MRWILFLLLPFLFACEMAYVPKPLAYHRIDLPLNIEREKVESNCAWNSVLYTKAELKTDEKNPCWKTIHFDRFNVDVFLTYFPINDTLPLSRLLDEMHQLSFDHQQKANAIEVNSSDLANGNMSLEYNIKGDAATPYQFCVTDSTQNYLRGALYFRTKPNYDSVYPVLNFMKTEMKVFMDSLTWTN